MRDTTAGSSSRTFSTVERSAASASGVGVEVATYSCSWMSDSPYAVRVASMLRSMYGLSLTGFEGRTWNCCTMPG